MSGKNINFDDKNVNKTNFYKSKSLFKINDIDANKILVPKKESRGKKAYINALLDIMIMMTLDPYV